MPTIVAPSPGHAPYERPDDHPDDHPDDGPDDHPDDVARATRGWARPRLVVPAT